MPKKSNTRRSDGRIAVQVYLGRFDGKRKYKTVYGRTQKEADQKASEIREQMEKGIDLFSENRSFDFWAERFLLSKKNSVSIGWYQCIEQRMQNFIKFFGKTDISKIRLCDVQELINEIARCNPYTGKQTAKKTMIEYVSTIKQFFMYCAANRIIDRSPIEDLLTVPPGTPPKERHALTKEQQQWIIDTPHRAQTAAMIMLFAGLRRGELTALLWSDIDFDKRTISITKSYSQKANCIKGPKTKAGIRKIPIPNILLEYLKTVPRKSVIVFPNMKGTYMSYSAWQKLWETYMRDLNKKYGYALIGSNEITIDTFTAHELRHTYATMLYDAGVDVLSAKEFLGHNDIQTTLGIYTHLTKEKEQTDINKLDAFLNQNNAILRDNA